MKKANSLLKRLAKMTGYFDDVEFAVYGKNDNYEYFAEVLG